MKSPASIDERSFRKLLSRNVGLPLAVGVLSAVLFVVMISYLLSVIKWVEHSDRVINNANEAMRLTVDLETGMRGFLITGDEHFLDPYAVAKPQITAQLQSLQTLVSDNAQQVDRLMRLEALQNEWNAYAQSMVDTRAQNGDYRGAVQAGRGKRLTDEIRKEYDDFIKMEQQLRVARNEDVSRTTVVSIGLYLLFVLGLSGFLAYIGRRDLIALSKSYNDNFESQIKTAQRLEQQAWLRNGQTELAEQVLGRLSLHTLGRNILQFCAQYLGSVVAAVYVREDHGGLTRVACYGFSREQEAQGQFIHNDEGMVGQAAQQDKLIRLDSVPADYFIKVSSGLGEGSPRSVLVVPTSDDERVNGVIELGFLRPLEDRDVELFELIADNIGMSIEAARYRQRLQEVLAETQQLNEQLQVQQEELKTANEELEEQSRILKESQTHLETQQAELEQTNEQLADQALALAAQRDAMDQKNTELNQAQVQLEERAEELQRSSKYKSEFLANMSHELRTPLNSSLILAKLLSENPHENLTAEQVKFAESIYSAGNDLLNLINDILDISKVEAGKLEVRPENTSVPRLVDGLRSMFQPLAGEKALDFQVELQPGTPPMIFTDRQRLEQILKNLLSNAIKFTEKGQVSLTVSRQPGEGIAFTVRDSGIGIAAEQQESIFEAFRQADGTTNRRYGGTGLGLSISRDLANLLGGSISVTSEPGQGSIFTLLLPEQFVEQDEPYAQAPVAEPAKAVVVAAPPAPQPVMNVPNVEIPRFMDDREKAPFTTRCILVIEDEPNFARILFDLAHELGYHCLVAHGADEGFSLAAEFIPDAILLDMRLPDHSGLTVLQRLKELAPTRHIPVHVISVEDRVEAAMHMGAVGYAVKPTTREELKDVFARLEAKLTQKVKRVLLVEDDDLQRDSIARLIGDDDIEITAVGYAQEALDLLRSHIYDCMVIDLKLPDMLGGDLLKRMSTEDICSFPPVIVYTGRNLTRDEEAELRKYSRSIIIKGARSPERLLDEVTLFLHKVESQLSHERQTMLKTARSRDKVFEGRKVLLVDDDVRNIFALTSALEQKGAIVVIGRNGREAIERLNEVDDIDLVLMDVMMPEMDGYEATVEIRKNPRWRKLPIIAVTAKAMKDDQERCLQAGSNDYLAKPIDLDRLFSLIRVWLPKMERL